MKLHPLQVEAQPRADGFDEALLQGLGGKGRNPVNSVICKYQLDVLLKLMNGTLICCQPLICVAIPVYRLRQVPIHMHIHLCLPTSSMNGHLHVLKWMLLPDVEY